jgi:DNA-binding NarL/FixJ family response regulator
MFKLYKICITEDVAILRASLKVLLETHNEFKVVAEAVDGIDLLNLVELKQPDLVLLDISMPRMNGLDALREIKRTAPHIKVMMLSVHDLEEYVVSALRFGADGYLLKSTSPEELKVAMDAVLSGKIYVSPGISGLIMQSYISGKAPTRKQSSLSLLTQREREHVKLIAEGYSNKEIARFLKISVKTVEKHRNNLMRKLDLHNVVAVTNFAVQHGLVEPDSVRH